MFRLFKKRNRDIPMPVCFGSRPGPQQQAENDCVTCLQHDRCVPMYRFDVRYTPEEIAYGRAFRGWPK